jgi:hypothetical protein
MAELEQFALDSEIAPARVLSRHTLHHGGDDVVDRSAFGSVRVSAPPAHEMAVPAHDRARGDQRWPRSLVSSRRMRPAKTARPAQFRRGAGFVRRSTATS